MSDRSSVCPGPLTMPELPEVETIARQLDGAVVGRRIEHVELRRPDVLWGDHRPACVVLRGRTIRGVRRRGKRIIIGLDDGLEVVFHLGMTGRLLLSQATEPEPPHTHLCLTLGDGAGQLRFCDPRRFGGVWLRGKQGSWIGSALGPLGLEPLEMTLRQFRQICRRRQGIKALLLNQQVIAGVGNIYCDEALFRAGVHPARPADRLDDHEVSRLCRSLRSVLRAAIRAGGSSISDYQQADGSTGRYQKLHRVYGRAGRACPRCGGTIHRTVVAGRGTHICPRCQRRRPAGRAIKPTRRG